jgi:hypothetical protein
VSTTTKPTTRYRVVSPYVTLRIAGSLVPPANGRHSAWTLLGFYLGALVPESAHPEDIERHLASGFLEAVEVDG